MNKPMMMLVLLAVVPWSAGCDAGGSADDAPGVATTPATPAMATDDTSDAVAHSAASPAAACRGCHQGGMSLAGRDVDALAEKIRSILDGERAHAPLRLEDSSDEAIAKLAEELASD